MLKRSALAPTAHIAPTAGPLPPDRVEILQSLGRGQCPFEGFGRASAALLEKAFAEMEKNQPDAW
jgi:hypothetical protein